LTQQALEASSNGSKLIARLMDSKTSAYGMLCCYQT